MYAQACRARGICGGRHAAASGPRLIARGAATGGLGAACGLREPDEQAELLRLFREARLAEEAADEMDDEELSGIDSEEEEEEAWRELLG